jgi:hypothetical protein
MHGSNLGKRFSDVLLVMANSGSPLSAALLYLFGEWCILLLGKLRGVATITNNLS